MPQNVRIALAIAGFCALLVLYVTPDAPYFARQTLWVFVLLIIMSNVLRAVQAKRERLEASGFVADPVFERRKRRRILVGVLFLLAGVISPIPLVRILHQTSIGNTLAGLFIVFGVSTFLEAIGFILVAPIFIRWYMSLFPIDRQD